MKKVYFSLQVTLSIIVLVSFSHSLCAFHAEKLLQSPKAKTFKHWNVEKKKITGYTKISYQFEKNDSVLKEISRNLDEDKKAFSQKVLWFTAGELIRYEESEFENDFKTINTYNNGKIETVVIQKGEKTSFSIPVKPDLVPFEVVTLYLQKKLPILMENQSMDFTLYLPFVAIELKKQGLPTSFSALEVKASVVQDKIQKTILGERELITIEIRPTSFLIQAFLPEEKSVFRFTFLKEAPYELIMFEEGKTQIVLSEIVD